MGKETHGQSKTRLYSIWRRMKQRCTNPKDSNYRHYGGKGIKVCDEWLHNFSAFSEWAYSNGYNDTLTIDRVDTNKGYSPSNCRWTTWKEQENNRSNNRLITYKGKTQTMAQWIDELGLNRSAIKVRLYRGWSIEKTFETPIQKHNSKLDN